jgi:hypothetical protein
MWCQTGGEAHFVEEAFGVKPAEWLWAESLRFAGLPAEEALGDACHSGRRELTLP